MILNVCNVDTQKLNNGIYSFRSESNNENPYLFMNEDTAQALVVDVGAKTSLPENLDCKYRGEYHGYKVFIDSTRCFGEVELR